MTACLPRLTSFALPGLSRENSSSSRPGSALSAHRNTVGGVRLRPGSAGGRRQRPLSIATTGMTASMYEERQRPTPTSTPSHTRGKGAGMSAGESSLDPGVLRSSRDTFEMRGCLSLGKCLIKILTFCPPLRSVYCVKTKTIPTQCFILHSFLYPLFSGF